MRVLDKVPAANIGSPLLMYRIHENNRSKQYHVSLVEEDAHIKEEYWNRNGLHYPKAEESNMTTEIYQSLQEKRIFELEKKGISFKGKNHYIEKVMLDAYMTDSLDLTLAGTYKRYIEKFIFLYRKRELVKIYIWCYSVFRIGKRKARLCLEKLGGRRT